MNSSNGSKRTIRLPAGTDQARLAAFFDAQAEGKDERDLNMAMAIYAKCDKGKPGPKRSDRSVRMTFPEFAAQKHRGFSSHVTVARYWNIGADMAQRFRLARGEPDSTSVECPPQGTEMPPLPVSTARAQSKRERELEASYAELEAKLEAAMLRDVQDAALRDAPGESRPFRPDPGVIPDDDDDDIDTSEDGDAGYERPAPVRRLRAAPAIDEQVFQLFQQWKETSEANEELARILTAWLEVLQPAKPARLRVVKGKR